VATFVLVHGAWGGAHGFGKVRRLLQAGGHEVFTPSLTGIGERAHLASPQVGLTTHITDAVNAVLYEDLRDIVLLGFSYGGLVITGALEHIASRVSHLVFLDAFVPADGDSLDTLTAAIRPAAAVGPGADRPSANPAHADRPSGGQPGTDWLVPPQPRDFDDPAEAVWSAARRTPQPARCFSEPVRLARPLEDYPFTRTYIKASAEPRTEPSSPFWAAADRARASSAWRYRELATTHMIPSNRPGDLARLLCELVPGTHA
jgi:pimeloyl-ACP methyl ester carboxylesterase